MQSISSSSIVNRLSSTYALFSSGSLIFCANSEHRWAKCQISECETAQCNSCNPKLCFNADASRSVIALLFHSIKVYRSIILISQTRTHTHADTHKTEKMHFLQRYVSVHSLESPPDVYIFWVLGVRARYFRLILIASLLVFWIRSLEHTFTSFN